MQQAKVRRNRTRKLNDNDEDQTPTPPASANSLNLYRKEAPNDCVDFPDEAEPDLTREKFLAPGTSFVSLYGGNMEDLPAEAEPRRVSLNGNKLVL